MCPTNAIVAPYVVDARKCISYLTIEHDGVIPNEYRQAMGNRIYGCDDCQLVCPYNQTAPLTAEADFYARPALHGQALTTLFSWSEAQFLDYTEGSPIRRIGYVKWQRNLTVALGNADPDPQLTAMLEAKRRQLSAGQFHEYGFSASPSSAHIAILTEHLDWALQQQQARVENRQQARLVRVVQKGLPRDA
jgi:epoxyqueuosine reductase